MDRVAGTNVTSSHVAVVKQGYKLGTESCWSNHTRNL